MFDAKAYRDSVVLPLQKNAAQQAAVAEALRGVNDAKDDQSFVVALTKVDMPALFAISPGMSDAELAQHLKSVEMFLNKGMPAVSKTLSTLLRAIKLKADGYSSQKFWDGLISAGAAASQLRLQEFGAAVKQQEVLGVITPERLRKAASAHGLPASMSDQQLAAAVSSQGVQVCADFESPRMSLTAAPLKKDLHMAFRSIIDVVLLHDRSNARPADIRIVGELSYQAGGGRRAITLDDVEKSKSAANTKSDDATESAKKTLNAIWQQCPTDSELRRLALSWFIDLADELIRKQGLMLGPALERLGIRGLAELDAKRVLAKATTAESGPNLNNVEELIASGDLQGARRLFTSLTDDQADGAKSERQKAVAAHLSDAEAKKHEAVEAYQKAIKDQDYDKAQQALSRARTMDREDADLARWMEQLPPATPASLRATFSAESGGIVLSWRSTQSSEVRYAIVRSDAGVPANPKDGHQIVAASTDEKVTDKAPPIARKLTYAVFAFKQGAQYSLPASVEVTVLPPPTDVETALTRSEATLFWRVPPQATGVSVELVRPDGSHQSFPASAREKLVIGDLKLGEKYKLTLTAHYVLDNGQHGQSTPVSVDATPRGAVLPVLDLNVASVAMPDGRPGLRAEWTDVPGYPIDLWSLPIDVTVKASSRAKASTLEDLGGKRVVGSIRASAVRHVMDFYAFQDVRTVLPVTWNGDDGIAGASVVAGSAPPPKNVEAIRYGQELVVSWHWPDGNYFMDVAWTARDDSSGRMRVDWHAYNRDGGVHIPRADLVTDVSVGTVATGGGHEYVFDPVHIQLQTACPSIAYQIKLPRGVFGGRQAEVYATSPHFHGLAVVIAVLAPGSFMPARASDGQEIARLALDFRHTTTHRASFPVPKIKSPYWVRLFPAREGEIALEDPPTTSMKG